MRTYLRWVAIGVGGLLRPLLQCATAFIWVFVAKPRGRAGIHYFRHSGHTVAMLATMTSDKSNRPMTAFETRGYLSSAGVM